MLQDLEYEKNDEIATIVDKIWNIILSIILNLF